MGFARIPVTGHCQYFSEAISARLFKIETATRRWSNPAARRTTERCSELLKAEEFWRIPLGSCCGGILAKYISEGSCKDVADDVAFDIGQAILTTLVTESQPFVINPKQV